MATKRTVHEVRSKGGEDVERSLKKIGAAGEETGKKIESGSQKAGRGLKAVDAAVAKTRSNMNRLANSLGPVGTGLSKLGAAGLAVAGGIAGAGGLFYLAKRAIDTADALAKSARAADISTDTFQEYAFAANQVGLTTEEMASSFTKFAKRIGDFNTSGSGPLITFLDKFDKGLAKSVRNAGSTEEALDLVVDRLTSMSRATERASLADAAFSESGRKVGILLAENGKALDEMRQRAHDLGLVLESELLVNAEEASDRLDEMRKILSTNLNRALLTLAPTIAAVGTAFAEAAPSIAAFVQSLLPLEALSKQTLELKLTEATEKLYATAQKFSKAQGEEKSRLLGDFNQQRKDALELQELLERRIALDKQARDQEQANAEAASALAERRKKQQEEAAAAAEAQKKRETERAKALKELAAAEEKAATAGLTAIEKLERAHDQEIAKRKEQLNAQIIDLQEYNRFRLASEIDTQTEISDIQEEADKKRREEAIKAAEKTAAELRKPFDNFVESTQNAFADLFTEALQGDVKNFEDFFKTIKQLAARAAGEIAALFIFSPQLFGQGGAGLTSSLAATAPGLANIGGGLASLGGGLLPAGGLSPLATLGLAGLGGGVLGYGLTGSRAGGLGGALGGAGGFYAGLLFGSGPLAPLIGAGLGAGLGGLLTDRLFGGGSNNKSRFGYTQYAAGLGGIQTPFGGININAAQNIDAAGIANLLKRIDENLAKRLSPEQIGAVSAGLVGTGSYFSAGKVDNEIFDVVKERLVRSIDAAVGNSVASQLLNEIPRSNQNIEALVAQAENIIQLVADFNAEGPATQAEQAIKALNEQFDTLADTAEKLGLSVEKVEEKRAIAIERLTTDFNDSIRLQILGFTDPLEAALEQLAEAQKQRLEEAKALGADLVEVERLNALERTKVINDAFAGSNSSIEQFLTSLKITGAGGLSIGAQAANAGARFTELLGLARTDPTARAELAALLPSYLDLQRQQLGSTPAFFEFTRFLESTLSNLLDTPKQIDTLTNIGAAITAGDNAVIATLEDTNKKLIAEIAELRADINLLLSVPRVA